MKRRYRLRRKADFQNALKGRRVFSGQGLVALAVPSRGEESRIGVTVSRRLKTAVERNRAKRRLRELGRLTLAGQASQADQAGQPGTADSAQAGRGIRYDVVLIARPAALTLPFAELRQEAEQAARRLTRT